MPPRGTLPGATLLPVHLRPAETPLQVLSLLSALNITEKSSSRVQRRAFWTGSLVVKSVAWAEAVFS